MSTAKTTPNRMDAKRQLMDAFPYVDSEMTYEILMFMRTMIPSALRVFQINRETSSLDDATLITNVVEYFNVLKDLRLRKDISPNTLARAIATLDALKLVQRYTSIKEENLAFARIIRLKQRHALETEYVFWKGVLNVVDDSIVLLMKRLPAPLTTMLDQAKLIVSKTANERMSDLKDALAITPREDSATVNARRKANEALIATSRATPSKNYRATAPPSSPFPMDSLPTFLQTEVLKKVDRRTLNNFASASKDNKVVYAQEKEAFYSQKIMSVFPFVDTQFVYDVLVFVRTMLPGVLDVFKLNREITALDDPTFCKGFMKYFTTFERFMKRKEVKDNFLAHAVINYYIEKILQRFLSTKEESLVFEQLIQRNNRDRLEKERLFIDHILTLTKGSLVQLDARELPAPLLSKWEPINSSVSEIATKRLKHVEAALSKMG